MSSELASTNKNAIRKKKELTADRYQLSAILQAVDWKPTLKHLKQEKKNQLKPRTEALASHI